MWHGRNGLTMWVAGGAIAAGLAGLPSVAPAAAAEQLQYRISHAMLGNIGTYSNTIVPNGKDVTVETRSHIDAKMLGIDMYREDSQRTEQWQGGRLVAFHSLTRTGHGTTQVDGVARGNQFLISTPQGTVAAPANVYPANPWSGNFVAASVMMRPDTGRLEPVSVSSGEPATVVLNNTSFATKRYQVSGKTKYTIWLDQRGIPLKFVVDDDSGKVTFTLSHCSNCGVEITDAGLGPVASQR
jgi:Family of unknown function (DUF6134)